MSRAWPLTAVLALCSVGARAPAQSPVDWMREREWTGGMSAGQAYDDLRQRLVVFGGQAGMDSTGSGRSRSDATWEWDGARWLERSPATRPSRRVLPAMAYDAARRLIVLYGGVGHGNVLLADTWTWDGVDWTQLSPAAAPGALGCPAMVYDAARQEIVLFGGAILTPSGSVAQNDTWTWNGVTWTQQSPATLPPPRWAHGMAYDAARQEVAMCGGYADSLRLRADTWIWNGANWTQRASLPAVRAGFGLAYDAFRQRVVLFGGSGTGSTNFSDTWEWNGTAWTVASPATNPSARRFLGMAYDPSLQRVVMFGGAQSTGSVWPTLPRETWTWDGTTWTVAVPATNPPARSYHAMASGAGGQPIVLFGGKGTAGSLDDTWIWDGWSWAQQHPVLSPPELAFHAMASGAGGQGVVLFGGCDSGNVRRNDTWIWSGATWTQMLPVTVPAARYLHAMTLDSTRQEVVLFGGYGATGNLGNTWVWNGATWAQVATTGPSPRRLHAMAYDPVGGYVLLFGGFDQSGTRGDTWSWNGASWTQVATGGPPPRSAHTMAYDAARQKIVLFGGNTNTAAGGYLSDAWEWDGAAWTQLPTTERPLGRGHHTMAYDAPRQRIAVFGGRSTMVGNFEDTWYLGALDRAATPTIGTGCAGTQGVPLLGSGVPYVGNPDFTLDLVSACPNSVCLFGFSFTQGTGRIGSCNVFIAPTGAIAQPAVTNASGCATVEFALPRVTATIGISIFTQAFVADQMGTTSGLALTSGLELVLGD